MKAPFPYFGGKSKVASDVWRALGQPAHYIEPFFGSGAVLLNRPRYDAGSHTETICDADGHVANVWRALQADPDEVAKWCDWPVNHADLIARKKRMIAEQSRLLESLCADDTFFDAKLAGYWIWSASCWIGSGMLCPLQRPAIGSAGQGVHAKGRIPHISDSGKSVHGSRRNWIYEWFGELSARLRSVRVVCGDWSRVCGGNWQSNIGTCGMFFDPPYGVTANRDSRIYHVDSLAVADDVRAWCLDRGSSRDYRIVLAGYVEEHESLTELGWTVKRWSASGGYANLGQNKGKNNRHREALFFSPHCL